MQYLTSSLRRYRCEGMANPLQVAAFPTSSLPHAKSCNFPPFTTYSALNPHTPTSNPYLCPHLRSPLLSVVLHHRSSAALPVTNCANPLLTPPAPAPCPAIFASRPAESQLGGRYVGGFSAACEVELLTRVFSRFGNVLFALSPQCHNSKLLTICFFQVIDVSILKRRRSSDNLCCAFIKYYCHPNQSAILPPLQCSCEITFSVSDSPRVMRLARRSRA
jgi:hypothetical protein